MERRVRTALFGGTFDPIHNGHIMLANYLVIKGIADEVMLMVSPDNPLKHDKILTPEAIRLEMAATACRDLPGVIVSDFEFSLPRPSYTASTLLLLAEKHPERDIRLLVGSDNWLDFGSWRDPDIILSRFGLLVYPRPGYPASTDTVPRGISPALLGKVSVIPDAPTAEISSTFIRETIRAGHDPRGFLPESVARYIAAHGLYTQNQKK